MKQRFRTPTWILLAEQTSSGLLSHSSGMLFVKKVAWDPYFWALTFHMLIKHSESPKVGRQWQSTNTSWNICWTVRRGGVVSSCQYRWSWTGSAETKNAHLAPLTAGTIACQTQMRKRIQEEEPTGLMTIYFQLSALIAVMICHPLVGL